MDENKELGRYPSPSATGRSAALRVEPATQSQAEPAATNATCPVCDGDGLVEHPAIGIACTSITQETPHDPPLVECEDCGGTGKVDLDDFECDFEGAIGRLVDEIAAEIKDIPEDERARHFMGSACQSMLSFLNADHHIPDFVISMTCQRIVRCANRLEQSLPEESRWKAPDFDDDEAALAEQSE